MTRGRADRRPSGSPLTWIQVLNYQGLHCLERCLESLRRMRKPSGEVRLVVVDNASTDGSLEIARRKFPDLEVLESTWNRGFAGGNNLGLREALEEGADYAVLVNMDARVAPDCIAKLVAAAENRPEAALVGATICSEDGKLVEFDGRQFDPVLTAGGYADTPRGRRTRDKVSPAAYACGAGMLLRLEAFREIGLFSESFFAYHEDVELALRARLFGYEVVNVGDAFVFHARGGAGAGDRFRDFMGTRNLLSTLIKIYDRPSWLQNSESLMDHFLGSGQPMRSQAILAALFDAPQVLRQRRRLRAEVRKTYKEILAELPFIG